MDLPNIPSPLGSVYLSSMASPSLVANTGQCPMGNFARDKDTQRFLPGLIKGPQVELGILLHRAIEIAQGRKNLFEIFTELKLHRQVELRGDDRRGHYSELESALGDLKWSERMALLQTYVGDGQEITAPRVGDVSGAGHEVDYLTEADLRWPSINWEVHLQSSVLGLSGRADRVELELPRTIVITDVKTGSIFSENGEPKREYVLQMAAYEALAKEIWPDANIQLYLESGHSLNIKVTSNIRKELQERLTSLREMRKNISNSVVSALSVQKTGGQCFSCSIRHLCKSYRKILEDDSFLNVFEVEELKNLSDGFGVVVKKQIVMESHVVNVQTASGRMIQLRSRYEWQVSELKVGENVYFFSFNGKPNSNRMSASTGLPSNFSDDFRSGRNWRAEVFRSA